jgi:N-acetyl-anhydromuramyl-L-alanine amidase AmpD
MQFIKSRWFTPTDGRKLDVIVIHTMEAPEKGETAEAIARYFQRLPATRKASAHYCIDNNSVVQCVLDKDVAYAAPGCNHNGIQLEHAGYARQKPADWKDAYSQAMLRRSAALTARLCRRYSIPVRWLSIEDVRRGRRGITSHNNVSRAFRRSTHWDPGEGFPKTQYLQMVKEALAPKRRPVPTVGGGVQRPL